MPLALAAALAFVALSALGMLVAAPALPALPSALIYAAGSVICHQIPERSFYLDAYQLPVCARCFGIYLGAALGAIGAVAWRVSRAQPAPAPPYPRPPAPRHRDLLVLALAVAAAPTAITFGLEWGFGWPMSNALRAAAGVPLGAMLAAVVTGAQPTLHYDGCARPRPIGHGRPPSI